MRRVLIVIGALVMAYAVIGSFGEPGLNLVGVAIFLIAGLALHDGVFLPVVLAAGALLGKIVPSGWRATVRLVAVVDLAVVVIALPLLLASVPADNPTILPRSYGVGLLVTLVAATVLVTAAALGRKGIERWRSGPGRRPRG